MNQMEEERDEAYKAANTAYADACDAAKAYAIRARIIRDAAYDTANAAYAQSKKKRRAG